MQELSISEICQLLDKNFAAFASQVAKTPDNQFEENPQGKWSVGQHLAHLIESVAPVNQAFYLPKFALAWIFGKANRPSRSYTELVQRYTDKLAEGGVATGRFVPKTIVLSQKNKLLSDYEKHKNRLIKHLQNFTEKDLDTLIAPHPLLGKITLRELMYFTIYHTEHHLKLIAGNENLK